MMIFYVFRTNKIIEYTSTSGTLGSPVTIALTENDLQRLAFNEYSSFLCADGKPDDIYQLMLTLDRQFMAGMAYYAGIRKMGAGIITCWSRCAFFAMANHSTAYSQQPLLRYHLLF